MIKEIYTRACRMLQQKPVRLWGISLLACLLDGFGTALFGIIPGVGLAISWLLSTGMENLFLRSLDGQDVRAVQLFDTCRDWNTVKRVLAGVGWSTLWVFLWGLIPLGSGIILALSVILYFRPFLWLLLWAAVFVAGLVFMLMRLYSYRLVPFILLNEPEVAPTDAIAVSAQRTMGHRGKLFLADILPSLLLGIVCAVLGVFGSIPYVGILFRIISVVVTVIVSLLMPLFLGLVRAGFYEKLSAAPAEPEAPAEQ